MTYCVGVFVDAGLVLAADSRTNAGVDQIASVEKMFVFEQPGERVIVLLSAGNLAITQSVINLLNEGCAPGGDEVPDLMSAPTMYRAARAVGDALREVHRIDAPHLAEQGIDFNAAFIVGGQIGDERPRLFQVYAAGNFIEASAGTPFLQIGETKYGKPILDRIVEPGASLPEVAKCVLLSYASTMRSNVSVGLPIDLLCYAKDSLTADNRTRIDAGDAYFKSIRGGWDDGLVRVFQELPDPDFVG